MIIKDVIKDVVEKRNLSQECAYEAAIEIMNGRATDAEIAGLLVALRMKGETRDEITGFVRAMREKVIPVKCNWTDVIDTCGTGGDSIGTFNISTISAFVAAGAGCRIAKHGNRSVSSQCGSADLLQHLGVKIEISPEKMAECIEKAGIGFLFAPLLHKAMKYASRPRREIGIRTIFNILGPLTNPAGARRQVLGVFSKDLIEPIANVLQNLGCEHCMVVHGSDGLDEITITDKTYVSEFCNGAIRSYTIEPEDFGIKRAYLRDIRGGSVEDNARIALNILNKSHGPTRDTVMLNAGAAIYVSGNASSLIKGIELAGESIDKGMAMSKFQLLKELTQ